MTRYELMATRDRCDKARTMVANLCKPAGSPGSREWVMSIPARLDYDPDIVIAASLDDIPLLIARVVELERVLAAEGICA